jgi:hypothetical protein
VESSVEPLAAGVVADAAGVAAAGVVVTGVVLTGAIFADAAPGFALTENGVTVGSVEAVEAAGAAGTVGVIERVTLFGLIPKFCNVVESAADRAV